MVEALASYRNRTHIDTYPTAPIAIFNMHLDTAQIDPGAACPCGSNLKYGECHREINEAPAGDVLSVAQRIYARRWQSNASYYEGQGLYTKLADHLFVHRDRPARILDIGCGRGEGMSALRDKMRWPGSRLIGIDENYDCLAAAAKRLGIVTPQPRLRRVSGEGKNYDLETIPGRFPTLSPVMLVHSDMLRADDEFVRALRSLPPFDAVTLWFAGTHAARQFDQEVHRLGLVGDKALRHAMEFFAMEHAVELLRPGGYLQIVHRGATNQPSYLEKQFRDEMSQLPGRRPTTIVDVNLEPYDEPGSGDRIGIADPQRPQTRDCRNYAMSIIFRVQ